MFLSPDEIFGQRVGYADFSTGVLAGSAAT
jgi:hypothetical protein